MPPPSIHVHVGLMCVWLDNVMYMRITCQHVWSMGPKGAFVHRGDLLSSPVGGPEGGHGMF